MDFRSFLVLIFSFSFYCGLPSGAMEMTEENIIEHVPLEVTAIIINEIAQASSAQEAIKNVKSFFLSSKKLSQFLADRATNKFLIQELAKKHFNNDFVKAALALGTTGAQEALTEYMQSLKKAEARTPLFQALFKNDTANSIKLLKAVDPNTRDAKLGRTPAMIAADKNNIPLLEFLLSINADFNAKDNAGATPLIYAVRAGNKDAILFLLDKAKVDINEGTQRGFTPLLWAIHRKHTSIAQLLIEKGANITKEDKRGINPLIESARHGELSILKFLIYKQVPIDHVTKEGYSALLEATGAPENAIAIIKRLLAAGANPLVVTNDGGNFLELSVLSNDLEMVKIALGTPAREFIDTLVFDQTPLMIAAEHGNIPIVEELLKEGADLNIQNSLGQSAMDIATPEVLEVLQR